MMTHYFPEGLMRATVVIHPQKQSTETTTLQAVHA